MHIRTDGSLSLLFLTNCFAVYLKVPQVCSVHFKTEILSAYFKNGSYKGREVPDLEEHEFIQKNSAALATEKIRSHHNLKWVAKGFMYNRVIIKTRNCMNHRKFTDCVNSQSENLISEVLPLTGPRFLFIFLTGPRTLQSSSILF